MLPQPESPTPLARTILICLVVLLAGIFIGSQFEARVYGDFFDNFKTIRRTDDPYKLVAPLVGIDSPSALLIGHYGSLDRTLKKYAAEHSGDIDSYSLYYRDLNSSQWFGENDDRTYIPASLLKIALAFAAIKQEEADPHFAQAQKTYAPSIARVDTSAPFLEPSKLIEGKAYTVDDLLEKMIVDSDNGAKDLLYSEVDRKYFLEVFRLLGVAEPDVPTYELSPKEYALFFRTLYGGTYLSVEDSERLLEIFTRVKFRDGIVAGVPADITVAHKFGTFTLTDTAGAKTGIELHDCGIVYHPEDPFILCIMTKGQDADKLAHFIAGMSALVYASTDAHIQ